MTEGEVTRATTGRVGAGLGNQARVDGASMSLRGGLLSTLMYLIFATTWPGAKYGLESFAPFTLALIRILIATAVLFAICGWRGYAIPREPRALLAAGAVGIFTAAMPSLVGFWGVQRTQASLANVILATQPFLVAILAHWLLADERLNLRKVAGLCVGFAGVGLISLDKTGGNGANSLAGQLALLGSALAVAFSAVLGKSLSRTWQPLPLTAVQTAGGAVVVLVAAVLFESGAPMQVTPNGIAAAVYLALGPTVVGYSLWVSLIDRYTASGVASFAFTQPIFGIALGWLLLSEQFSFLTVLGALLVTWSIVTVNRRV